MFYINKVWLSGVVRTHPKIRKISEKTRLTSFVVSIFEEWESPSGEKRNHRNDVPVEVLGREAEKVCEHLRPGDWVSVDGYLRSETFKGKPQLRIRVFNISYEEAENHVQPRASEEVGGGG